jgi:flagellar basal-body rod protein FlgG
MTDAITISAIAMNNATKQLDIVSQNMANANTNGYMREIAVNRAFSNYIDTELTQFSSQLPVIPETQNVIDFSHGALRKTDNPLDFAIEGDGFFEVMSGKQKLYSRHGSFSINEQGQLINSSGMALNGSEGPLLLTSGEVEINSKGEVYQGQDYMGRIKLVSILEPQMMTKQGNGLFAINQAGLIEQDEISRVRQGYIESSNVEAVSEMVNMMTLMRNFEANAKVISSYDDMLSNAISSIAEF